MSRHYARTSDGPRLADDQASGKPGDDRDRNSRSEKERGYMGKRKKDAPLSSLSAKAAEASMASVTTASRSSSSVSTSGSLTSSSAASSTPSSLSALPSHVEEISPTTTCPTTLVALHVLSSRLPPHPTPSTLHVLVGEEALPVRPPHAASGDEHNPRPSGSRKCMRSVGSMVASAPLMDAPIHDALSLQQPQRRGQQPLLHHEHCVGLFMEGLAMLRRQATHREPFSLPTTRRLEVRTPYMSVEGVQWRRRERPYVQRLSGPPCVSNGNDGDQKVVAAMHETEGSDGHGKGEQGWVAELAERITAELRGQPSSRDPMCCSSNGPITITPIDADVESYAEVVTLAMGTAAIGKSSLLLGSTFARSTIRNRETTIRGTTSKATSWKEKQCAPRTRDRKESEGKEDDDEEVEGGRRSLLSHVLCQLFRNRPGASVAVSLLEVRDAAPLSSASPQLRATESIDLLSPGGRVDTYTPRPALSLAAAADDSDGKGRRGHYHNHSHSRSARNVTDPKATTAAVGTRTGCFMRRACDLPAAQYVSCSSAAEVLAVVGEGLSRARAAGWEDVKDTGETRRKGHGNTTRAQQQQHQQHHTKVAAVAAMRSNEGVVGDDGDCMAGIHHDDSEGDVVVRPSRGQHPLGSGHHGHTLLTLVTGTTAASTDGAHPNHVGVWKLWDLAGPPATPACGEPLAAATAGRRQRGVGDGGADGSFARRTHAGLCTLLGNGGRNKDMGSSNNGGRGSSSYGDHSEWRGDPVCRLIHRSLCDTATLFTFVGLLQQDGALEAINESVLACAAAAAATASVCTLPQPQSSTSRTAASNAAKTQSYLRHRQAANASAARRVMARFAVDAGAFLALKGSAPARRRHTAPPPLLPTTVTAGNRHCSHHGKDACIHMTDTPPPHRDEKTVRAEEGEAQQEDPEQQQEHQPLSINLTSITADQSALSQPITESLAGPDIFASWTPTDAALPVQASATPTDVDPDDGVSRSRHEITLRAAATRSGHPTRLPRRLNNDTYTDSGDGGSHDDCAGTSPIAPPSVTGTQRPTKAEKRRSLHRLHGGAGVDADASADALSASPTTELFPSSPDAPTSTTMAVAGLGVHVGVDSGVLHLQQQPRKQTQLRGRSEEALYTAPTGETTLLMSLQDAFAQRMRRHIDDLASAARAPPEADTLAELARIVYDNRAELDTLMRAIGGNVARACGKRDDRPLEIVSQENAALQAQLARSARKTLWLEEKLLVARGRGGGSYLTESATATPTTTTPPPPLVPRAPSLDPILEAFTEVVAPLVTLYELAREATERVSAAAAAAAKAEETPTAAATTTPSQSSLSLPVSAGHANSPSARSQRSDTQRLAALLSRAMKGKSTATIDNVDAVGAAGRNAVSSQGNGSGRTAAPILELSLCHEHTDSDSARDDDTQQDGVGEGEKSSRRDRSSISNSARIRASAPVLSTPPPPQRRQRTPRAVPVLVAGNRSGSAGRGSFQRLEVSYIASNGSLEDETDSSANKLDSGHHSSRRARAPSVRNAEQPLALSHDTTEREQSEGRAVLADTVSTWNSSKIPVGTAAVMMMADTTTTTAAMDRLHEAAAWVRDCALRMPQFSYPNGERTRAAALPSSFSPSPFSSASPPQNHQQSSGPLVRCSEGYRYESSHSRDGDPGAELFDALAALQSATAAVSEEVREAAERERAYLNTIL